jgi:hypothetical protein
LLFWQLPRSVAQRLKEERKGLLFLKKAAKHFRSFDFGAAGEAQPREGQRFFGSFFQKRAAFFRLSSLRPVSPCHLGSYKKRSKKLLTLLQAALPDGASPDW